MQPPGFPLLPPSTSCFEALAKNNAWFAHFARYGLLTDMFLPQALLSMFVNWLPLRTLLHCLDFLEEGLAALLSLALAVLELKESQLLQLQSFEELMEALQGLKESQISSSVLLERAEAGFAQASEVLLDCEGSPIVRLKKIQRKGSRVVDEEGNDILASAPGNLPNNLEWIAQESPTSVSDWWEGHSPLNLGASLFRWAFPDCEVCRAPGGVHHEPSG
ncbi:unnamed protein product [Effrenium voratum]|nr:unnamed protein product [Effrenium voratum]